jgi:serine/threonine-protein kinase
VGLAKAHEAGVVHRDIKPANIFLADGDANEVAAKVLDFGIAKIKMDKLAAGNDDGLTRTGSMLGSPHYMSPEQAQGLRTIDHRTDIWSLGIVMYKALTGRTPYSGVDALGQVILAICSQPPRPIQEMAPWVPPEVAAIVHRAIRQDPAERFQSATAMFEAIRPLLGGGRGLHRHSLRPLSQAERSQIAQPLSLMPTPRAGYPLSQSAMIVENGDGNPSYTHAGVTSSQIQPRRSSAGRLALAAVGVFAITLGAAWGVSALRKQPKAAATTVATEATRPTPPPTASPDKSAEPANDARTVTVTVTPAKCTVEVDGAKVEPGPNGEVKITGMLGSRHHVRVVSGKHESTTDVIIGLDGAAPDKISLASAPSATAAATARPPPTPAPSASDIKAIRVFE